MLIESLTSTLFYYTSLKSAYNIMKDNNLNLTPTVKSKAETGSEEREKRRGKTDSRMTGLVSIVRCISV